MVQDFYMVHSLRTHFLTQPTFITINLMDGLGKYKKKLH